MSKGHYSRFSFAISQLNKYKGVSDIRDHAINTFESLFYGQYVPQTRRESKATIRRISRVSNISRRTSDNSMGDSQRERLLGVPAHSELQAIMSTKYIAWNIIFT